MKDPIKGDFSFDDLTDPLIKLFLDSGDPYSQLVGLAMLDAKYEGRVRDKIREWSNAENWRLSDWDIDVIWLHTTAALKSYVRSGKFRRGGSLWGLVSTFAKWRAKDFLRRRKGFNCDVDIEDIEDVKTRRCDEPHEQPNAAKMIRERFHELTEKQKLVVTHQIRLFYASDGKIWPTPRAVMESVNADGTHSLSLDAVKKLLERAHEKLRGANNGFRQGASSD